MNSVHLLGNMTKDPDVRYTKTGTAITSFTVAVTHEYVNTNTGEVKEQTAYVNCVAWGKLGEAVGSLSKGSRVCVQGRLQTRSYEAKDNTKRYVTEVVCNFIGASVGTYMNEATETSGNFDSFESSRGGVHEEIPF